MKIVLTGGGSGGHFFPLIAVAQEINALVRERNLVRPELYYLSDVPYDESLLYENEIEFRRIPAGKIRRYASLENAFDFFKTCIGVPAAILTLFNIYPDVIFSKGSYVSVPVLVAARLLRIPVFIHESDAVPGRANLFAAPFADRIAISYPEAAKLFPTSVSARIASIGNPIRKELRDAVTHDAHEYLQLSKELPTILVLGGSQGSEALNDCIVQALPDLLRFAQVVHQTGKGNYEALKIIVDVELEKHPHKERYKMYPFLNALGMRMASGAATIIVSRAGSGSIFEIANWEKPSILVPIPEVVSHDQRHNAFAYARTGACQVIEQNNLTPHVLVAELERIINEQPLQESMKAGARSFKRPDAARKLAEELVRMSLEHEL